jgi:predicted nucleic acid-binding protein
MTNKINILDDQTPFFIDTGILISAFSEKEKKKRKEIASMVLCAGIKKAHTGQKNIIEFIDRCPNLKNKDEIVEDMLLVFKILGYSKETMLKAINLAEKHKIDFKAALIAQAMIDNQLVIIFTENLKDFKKIKEIKAINPFVYFKNKK